MSEPGFDREHLALARVIARSFWRMQGGEPGENVEPNEGDMQLADDILRSFRLGIACRPLGGCVGQHHLDLVAERDTAQRRRLYDLEEPHGS